MNIIKRETFKWLWSFTTIRDQIFNRANIEKLHINKQEAKKYLERFETQQKSIKDKAEQDEKEQRMVRDAVMNQMKLHRDELQRIKIQLEDPLDNQAKDNIRNEDKFAIIFANEYYSDDYIGMSDLPPVNDDFKNIIQTVEMLYIPSKNIFAFKNIKHQKMREVYEHVTNTIVAQTRCLKERTGIYDKINRYYKGIEWIRLREHAMKEGASLDYAIVSSILL